MTDSDEEIAALKRRLEQLERPAQPGTAPIPEKSSTKAIGCAFAVILVLLAGVSMCSSLMGDSGPAAPTLSSWTPPEGYILERAGRGREVATKWFKPTRSECDRSGASCFGVSVIAKDGCPRTLYAEITILDSADRNIGWTNDTAQAVQPGEEAKLIFRTYEDAAHTARISEINCY